MKKAMQKPIALFLALIMAFGAMPFAGFGLIASADDGPVLESVAIVPETITLTKLGQTYDLTLVPKWKNGVVGEFLAKDITWRTSQPEYVTVEADADKPYATVTAIKLPKELDQEMTVYITALYVNVLGVTKTANATVKVKRMNNIDNKLRGITLDPVEVTLKDLSTPVPLKVVWDWNEDLKDGQVVTVGGVQVKDITNDGTNPIPEGEQKFQLYTDDINFTCSNNQYVKIEKLPGNLKDGPGKEDKQVYAEDQDVISLTAIKLPETIGTSIPVTITATYLNKYGVEKKATARVEVKLATDEIVLESIKVKPDSLLLTEVNTSYALDVEPVWKNGIAGSFDKKDVSWSITKSENKNDSSDTKTYLAVNPKSGVITVLQLPKKGEIIEVTVEAFYTDKNNTQKTAECLVTIQNKSGNTDVKSITVTPNEKTLTKVDEELQLYVVAAYENGNTEVLTSGVAFSSDNEEYVKVSSTGLVTVIKTPAPNAADVTVTIKAQYGANIDTCRITIPARKIYVDRLTGSQLSNLLVSELTYDFDSLFRYETYLTEQPPKEFFTDEQIAELKSVTLTCIPADAVQIDNETRKIKVMPIVNDTAVLKLVLTANHPSANCKPLEFDMTVKKDVPLVSVKWDYQIGSTGKSRFPYYEKVNGINRVAEYYYIEQVGSNWIYKFHTDPAWARDICQIKVTSSDPRVLKVDEKTCRLIPCGNGETELTITAKSPKSNLSKSDTIIVVINDSPYTPIKDAKIGYDEKTATNATYDNSSNTINLKFRQGITLKPLLTPNEAKLDQPDIYVTTTDNRKIRTVSTPTVTWKSSDPSVISIDKDGKVSAHKFGKYTVTITMTVSDNGVDFVKTINVHSSCTWWEVLIAILVAFFTGRWSKIPEYFAALFS